MLSMRDRVLLTQLHCNVIYIYTYFLSWDCNIRLYIFLKHTELISSLLPFIWNNQSQLFSHANQTTLKGVNTRVSIKTRGRKKGASLTHCIFAGVRRFVGSGRSLDHRAICLSINPPFGATFLGADSSTAPLLHSLISSFLSPQLQIPSW